MDPGENEWLFNHRETAEIPFAVYFHLHIIEPFGQVRGTPVDLPGERRADRGQIRDFAAVKVEYSYGRCGGWADGLPDCIGRQGDYQV